MKSPRLPGGWLTRSRRQRDWRARHGLPNFGADSEPQGAAGRAPPGPPPRSGPPRTPARLLVVDDEIMADDLPSEVVYEQASEDIGLGFAGAHEEVLDAEQLADFEEPVPTPRPTARPSGGDDWPIPGTGGPPPPKSSLK